MRNALADRSFGRESRTVAIGAVVIVVILLLGRGLPMMRSGTATLLAQATTARAERRHFERLTRDARRIERNAAAASARRDSLDRRVLPASTPAEAGALLALLVDAHAARAGVQLSSTSVRADSAFAGPYARVVVRAFATADVMGLLALLRSFEENRLLLIVRELTLTQPEPAADDLTPESLRLEFVIEAIARPGTAFIAGAP